MSRPFENEAVRAARPRRAALLKRLTDLAEAGAALPRSSDMGGVQVAYWDMRVLRRAGLIRVECRSNRRRVQIVATGRWTDWTELPPPMGVLGPLPADPEAAFAAAMGGRRYVDLPGYERVGTGGRRPARPAAYSPSTSSAAWAA